MPGLRGSEVIEIVMAYADGMIADFSAAELRELRRRCEARLPPSEIRALLIEVIDRRLAPRASPPGSGRN